MDASASCASTHSQIPCHHPLYWVQSRWPSQPRSLGPPARSTSIIKVIERVDMFAHWIRYVGYTAVGTIKGLRETY